MTGLESPRREAILRLLYTRDEGLPEPKRHSSIASGFVNKARSRTCPDCMANGQVMKGCETCNGFGTISGGQFDRLALTDELPDDDTARGQRPRDPYAQNDTVGWDPSRHDETHARDRAIEALDRQLQRPANAAEEIEAANRHPYAWELERAAMYRNFDYEALDRAAEWLRDHCPGTRLDCNFALGYLDVVLPVPLRAPAAVKQIVRGPLSPAAGVAAKDTRASQMLDRAKEGASPAEIAQEFRVSLRTVYRTMQEQAA